MYFNKDRIVGTNGHFYTRRLLSLHAVTELKGFCHFFLIKTFGTVRWWKDVRVNFKVLAVAIFTSYRLEIFFPNCRGIKYLENNLCRRRSPSALQFSNLLPFYFDNLFFEFGF